MNAGTRGGLQYHQKKDEAGYVISGEMLLEYDDGKGKIASKKLSAGESIHIPPGAVHRETAITDCVIFEISNPVFNDRVRMEESYGEKIEGGMPTTKPEEVKEGGPEVLAELLSNPTYQAKK
jgi:mannose-6-phosphate isomerase-like protein (cupin superfamily)